MFFSGKKSTYPGEDNNNNKKCVCQALTLVSERGKSRRVWVWVCACKGTLILASNQTSTRLDTWSSKIIPKNKYSILDTRRTGPSNTRLVLDTRKFWKITLDPWSKCSIFQASRIQIEWTPENRILVIRLVFEFSNNDENSFSGLICCWLSELLQHLKLFLLEYSSKVRLLVIQAVPITIWLFLSVLYRCCRWRFVRRWVNQVEWHRRQSDVVTVEERFRTTAKIK